MKNCNELNNNKMLDYTYRTIVHNNINESKLYIQVIIVLMGHLKTEQKAPAR